MTFHSQETNDEAWAPYWEYASQKQANRSNKKLPYAGKIQSTNTVHTCPSGSYLNSSYVGEEGGAAVLH